MKNNRENEINLIIEDIKRKFENLLYKYTEFFCEWMCTI